MGRRRRRLAAVRRSARMAAEAVPRRRTPAISSVALSPGSPLMLEVEGSLAYYVCHALQGSRYAHLSFEISGATVPVSLHLTLQRTNMISSYCLCRASAYSLRQAGEFACDTCHADAMTPF